MLNAIFSGLQVMLIKRTNKAIGIPDFAFALGDEVTPTHSFKMFRWHFTGFTFSALIFLNHAIVCAHTLPVAQGMMEFISGVQFLPLTIMMVHLCPAGSEGVSYAMFTTMNNVALILSSMLSTNLLAIWDVSEENLEAGKLDGFLKLTILTTCLQTCGVFFLPLLPSHKSDLAKLKVRVPI